MEMKKRLVYLYVSDGAADPDHIPIWSARDLTANSFAMQFGTEGFGYLFKKFIDTKLFDEILVVIESNRSPGMIKLYQGIDILVVPHIECLWPFLRGDDIMWARGGWRSWWKFLNEWHNGNRWLLFYRAASNRGAWTFWDIVLDDLTTESTLDEYDRFCFPINKPTNPELFYPTDCEKIYDVCVGASHIHDKKGQWRILDILTEYEKQYHETLHCVLPGSIHRGEKTSRLVNLKHDSIEFTGMVPRPDMNLIYNQSKLFLHLGASGQNDRGPLEALACGTPVMISHPEFHAPFLQTNVCPVMPFVFDIYPDNPDLAARQIRGALGMLRNFNRNTFATWYEQQNGIQTKILPQFTFLFQQLHEKGRNRKGEVIRDLRAWNSENAFSS